MKRVFPQQSIGTTNTAQPLFSTKLTAAITAGSGTQNIAVTSTSGILDGDTIILSPGASQDFAKVVSVVDGTHLQVFPMSGQIINPAGFTADHASGDFVTLSVTFVDIYIQRVDGDTNILYVGGLGLNPSATPPYGIISKLMGVGSGVQPTEFEDGYHTSKEDISQYWAYGTAGSAYNFSGDAHA